MSGPFGLEMGMKKDQVKIAEEIAPYTYGLINVPKPHSAFPSIIGRITPNNGLSCIRALGNNIITQGLGLEVKYEFENYINKLSKTYGEARVFNQLMQGSIWNRPEDWMSSIERKERVYMAQWLEEDKLNLPNNLNSISLGVYAYDDHNGQLVLEYYFNNSTAADEEIAALEDDAL